MTDPTHTPDSPSPDPGFDGVLADLAVLSRQSMPVPLSRLLRTLGARGHGPIILVLSVLMMLPTGLIPMMPVAIGMLLALTAIQMIVGGRGVSVPARLGRVTIPPETLAAALRRIAPLSRRLGRVLHPRFALLVHGALPLFAIALILLASAAVMIVFGAIPGLPFLLCIPALLFGLGLTAGDGVFVLLGFAATALAGWGVTQLAPNITWLWGG